MLSIETRKDLERRALEIAADLDAKTGPYSAEIVSGCSPCWHLVKSAPANESRAAKHLVERGFGVYLPMMRRWAIRRGRKAINSQLFFPGYVFLFVWDVTTHWRRIKACSGVQGIVCREELPIVVPDAVINKLQGLEFTQDDGWTDWRAEPLPAKKNKRKWRRTPKGEKEKRQAQPDQDWTGSVTISTRSYWERMTDVDSEERLSALHQALGLPSQRPDGQVSG